MSLEEKGQQSAPQPAGQAPKKRGGTPNHFTQQEIVTIIEMNGRRESVKAIAAELNRSLKGVRNKIDQLAEAGLTKRRSELTGMPKPRSKQHN